MSLKKRVRLAPTLIVLKLLLLTALLSTMMRSHGAFFPSLIVSDFRAGTYFLLHHQYLTFVCYTGAFILSILTLYTAPFLRSWQIRIPLIIILVLSFGLDQFILNVTGEHIDVPMMRTIWVERSSEVYLQPYWTELAFEVLRAFVLCFVLGLPVGRSNVSNWAAFIPLSAFASVAIIVVQTNDNTINLFPPAIAVGGISLAAAMSVNTEMAGAEVPYSATPSSSVRHIVFIVDESVRGDYIELNNPKLSNTPFLIGLGARVINFGVATSAANCSHESRMKISNRTGVSLLQYARHAGFRVVVIDGWKNMANYRYASERSAIDLYIPVTDDPPYVRDYRIAEKILEILSDDRQTFIYVAKFGVHYPYHFSYPSGAQDSPRLFSIFAALRYIKSSNVPMDPKDRDRLVSSYHRAITWSVDGFFQRLEPRLDLNNTLLLYTSDHGQSMWEDGYRTTHCSSHPHPGEAFVPLFVLTKAPGLETRMRIAASSNFNRASHFDIFSTFLVAMGYDEEWVAKKFGPNLFTIPKMRHRRFLAGGTWVTVQ